MASTAVVPYDYFFHSPEKYNRGERPALSDAETNFYQSLSQKTSPGQLYVYYNSETSSRPGAFDAKHAAKGYAIALSKKVPLSELAVSVENDAQFLLSSRWFGHVSIVKIPSEAIPRGMRERDMRDIIQRLTPNLDGGAPGFFEDRQKLAASLVSSSVTKRFQGVRDVSTWQAGISGHGHFAGLFKNKNTTLSGGQDNYFLAVHSDSDYLGEALNGYALQNRTRLTLGDLASSPQMEGVRNYSERNAKRVLAELADALSLSRDLVPRFEDLQAHPPYDSQAPPEAVSSLYADTVYNYLHDPIADGNTLVYYNSTARLNAFEQHNGRLALMRNAKAGLTILELDPSKDYTVFRHQIVSGKDESHVISHSNPFGAVPVGLGRLQGGDRRAVLKLSKLTIDDATRMVTAYEWRGKSQEATDLSNTDPDQVVGSLDGRLYSYRPLDQSTKTLLEFMLGSKTKLTNLKPVSVILPATQ